MPETKPKGRPPRKQGEILDAFVGIRLSRQMLNRLTLEAERNSVTRNELILGWFDRMLKKAGKQ